jgi:MFS family permease
LDRLGPRYFFAGGGVLILAGYLSSSFGTELWHLLIFYSVLTTLGESMVSSFTTTANLAPWFPKARGRILGLADAGNPLGSLVFLPVAQLLISAIGWQDTFWVLGVLFFVLVAPANFLFQRRPPAEHTLAELEQEAAPHALTLSAGEVEASSGVAGPPPNSGPSLWQAVLLGPPLWFLVLTRLLATLGRQLIQVHLVAFLLAAGYSPFTAAAAIASAGIVGLVGRPLTGALSDRAGRESIYTAGQGMHALAIVTVYVLGDGQSLWPIILFAGLLGLSDGIGGLMVGAKAADLFPAGTLGSVMGVIHLGRGIGIMAGPVIGGVMFDAQGDYRVAFPLAISLGLLAVGCMWGARLTEGQPGDSPVSRR